MRLTAPLIALLLLACGESDPEWCSRYCDGEGRESRPVKCLECPAVGHAPATCLNQWYETVVSRDGYRCWTCPVLPVVDGCAEVCFPCEDTP